MPAYFAPPPTGGPEGSEPPALSDVLCFCTIGSLDRGCQEAVLLLCAPWFRRPPRLTAGPAGARVPGQDAPPGRTARRDRSPASSRRRSRPRSRPCRRRRGRRAGRGSRVQPPANGGMPVAVSRVKHPLPSSRKTQVSPSPVSATRSSLAVAVEVAVGERGDLRPAARSRRGPGGSRCRPCARRGCRCRSSRPPSRSSGSRPRRSSRPSPLRSTASTDADVGARAHQVDVHGVPAAVLAAVVDQAPPPHGRSSRSRSPGGGRR